MRRLMALAAIAGDAALIAGVAHAQAPSSNMGMSTIGGQSMTFNPVPGANTLTIPRSVPRGPSANPSVDAATAAARAAAQAAGPNPMMQASSPHNHVQNHGFTPPNTTGVPAGSGSLNFTTTWTPNSSGQTPDIDTHVLLPAGNAPYTVSNGQNPVGVNTPTRPWPLGSAEFPRNVYYVQPTISFNGATALKPGRTSRPGFF